VIGEGVALDLHMRDLFKELSDIKDVLARLEKLMEQIALALGVRS
jgi:hypothetical protein